MVEYLFAQGGGVDVRIDFGGGYILMPQHGLDGSQVGPSFEQRCGKAVAQSVIL